MLLSQCFAHLPCYFHCTSTVYVSLVCLYVFFFKQKTAYELRISDGISDVCSSDLIWDDHEMLWRGLDSIKARVPEMILATTAKTKGCDAIAQAWAAERGVKVILFRLDRRLGAKAAFVRKYRLLALKPVEAVSCEGSGIQIGTASGRERVCE